MTSQEWQVGEKVTVRYENIGLSTATVVDLRDNEALVRFPNGKETWVTKPAPPLPLPPRNGVFRIFLEPTPWYSLSWSDMWHFWSLVNKTNGCWICEGPKAKNGYGLFECDQVPFLERHAYRIAYLLVNGAIPPSPPRWYVRHRCDVKLCVRPDHLVIGEAWENALDRIMRRRHRKQTGEVFTYEDDLDAAIAIYEQRVAQASHQKQGELQRRLAIIRAKKRGEQPPDDKTDLREEHHKVLMEWSRIYGQNAKKQEYLAARLREIKRLLGDTSPGLGLGI